MIMTYFDLQKMSGHKVLFTCDQSCIKNWMRRWQVEIGQGKSI